MKRWEVTHMKKFKVTIQFKDYNPMRRKWEDESLTAEIIARDGKEAAMEVKSLYASELSVSERDITIGLVKEV